MPKIYEVGHKLLALFDIEYHKFSADITDELMKNPNTRFRLSLQRAPLKKKRKKL